jgi:hypothetical protein
MGPCRAQSDFLLTSEVGEGVGNLILLTSTVGFGLIESLGLPVPLPVFASEELFQAIKQAATQDGGW